MDSKLIDDSLEHFKSFDYTSCLNDLKDFHGSIISKKNKIDTSSYDEKILQILMLAEEVHTQNKKNTYNQLGFIISPDHIIQELLKIIDRSLEIKNTNTLTLAKIYYYYLKRELDEAIEIIENFCPDKNLEFLKIAATVYMLNDLPESAKEYIEKACMISNDEEIIRLKKRIEKIYANKSQKRIKSVRWPNRMISPKELKSICEKSIVSAYSDIGFCLNSASKVATIGSCFANNLANALRTNGIDAKTFSLGEEINNTYTNKEIFEIMNGLKRKASSFALFNNTTLDSLVDENFIREIEEFKEYISNADLLVYTLGVSQGFFSFDDKPMLIKGTGGIDRTAFTKSIYRSISVCENVANCQEIIALAREIKPGIPIVFTLSPVPLARAFDTTSAIANDCLSKSILRVSVDELLNLNIKDINYWPSFEIAKWIYPHIIIEKQQDWHFGADDLNPRHVSRETVSLIMQLFLKVYFKM